MQQVILYTKLNCHLCDEAYQMLLDIAFDKPLKIDIIDITHTYNNVEEKYAERIPVIAMPHCQTELGWPFTREELKAYLEQ